MSGDPSRASAPSAGAAPGLPAAAAARLAEIYAEVDRRIAALGPVCFARGICCDFERVDHVLYASKLETDYALERVAPRTDLPPGREVCPYLTGGLCGARSVRMLGCRTYFCQEGWEPVGAEVYEWALHEIRQLCVAHDLGWTYAPALKLLAATSLPVTRDQRGQPAKGRIEAWAAEKPPRTRSRA